MKKYIHEDGCGVKASEPCTCEVLKPRDYVRVEDAFLSVGADPEHSATIHAYHHDPLVHALAHRLAECLERLRLIDGSLFDGEGDGRISDYTDDYR